MRSLPAIDDDDDDDDDDVDDEEDLIAGLVDTCVDVDASPAAVPV